METPWERARRKSGRTKAPARGSASEKRAGAPQINSGRLWFSKRDAKKFDFLIENRSTETKSLSISAPELKKITKDAFFEQNLPAMRLDFEAHNEVWLLIREVDFEDLYETMKTLEALVIAKQREEARGLNLDELEEVDED